MMQPHLSSKSMKNGIVRPLRRFNVVISTVVAAGAASVLILAMYQTVRSATDVSEYQPQVANSFDQATIDRLEELPLNVQSGDALVFPSGQRVNPFVE